ncbi:MAG: histidine--tRNA ligase [Candidatus Omnitrophica bacterium]|nr:histidine--tRNA ligase [Candidatus Omnitrophota bacterium]
MPDTLPEDAEVTRWLEDTARYVFENFGYGEIRTPLLEETEVFTRSIGEDTDIVEKEMYSFTDRGGKNVSLRPEGTAPIIRAYIEHGWHNVSGLTRLYYMGPMFRGERPQKGRLRQFHQIGAEIIGASGPYIDAELIFNLKMVLEELKVDGFTILINSLGCSKDRSEYMKALSEYLEGKSSGLCDNCRRRARTNVLRVLDCKNRDCKKVVSAAPSILGYLCRSCLEYYQQLKKILAEMDIPFKEKSDLVRGLDYYTGTIFEVRHPALGAQDAVAAGGRYDELTEQMGGPSAGATGYAIGVERLLLAVDRKKIPRRPPPVLVIPVDKEYFSHAFSTANQFRARGVSSDIDLTGRSLKGQMRRAGKESRDFVILIGEQEVKEGEVLLKNMREGTQQALSFDEAVKKLKGRDDTYA